MTRVVAEACFSSGGLDDPRVDSLCPGNATATTGSGSGEDCVGYDACDHGTHVAGIAAGNGGVASDSKIIALQVFTGLRDINNENLCGTGAGDNCISSFDSDILSALEHVYRVRKYELGWRAFYFDM